jgi:hypothetical protein
MQRCENRGKHAIRIRTSRLRKSAFDASDDDRFAETKPSASLAATLATRVSMCVPARKLRIVQWITAGRASRATRLNWREDKPRANLQSSDTNENDSVGILPRQGQRNRSCKAMFRANENHYANKKTAGAKIPNKKSHRQSPVAFQLI